MRQPWCVRERTLCTHKDTNDKLFRALISAGSGLGPRAGTKLTLKARHSVRPRLGVITRRYMACLLLFTLFLLELGINYMLGLESATLGTSRIAVRSYDWNYIVAVRVPQAPCM